MDFDSLWDYNDPAKTANLFNLLLQEKGEEMDVSTRAQLLTQLARTHSLQSDFAFAHIILDEVAPLLSDADDLTQVRYWLERGRTYNSNGEKEKAVALFKSAYERSQQTTYDYHTIDALHMLAIAEPDPKQQLVWSVLAIEWCEKTENERAKKWLGSLYNNTGWTYFDMARYEDALAIFEKSVHWREQFPEQPKPYMIAQWAVGCALRALGQAKGALNIQQTLWATYEEDDVWRGYLAEEIAECLQALGQKTENYFCLAHQYLSQDSWLATHEPARLSRLEQACQSDS